MKHRFTLPLAIIALLSANTINADVRDGLVLEYLFDNYTGITVSDTSGNGIDGTQEGEVNPTEDRHGDANQAAAFGGARDYISTPSSNNLIVSSELSVSAWVNLQDKGDRHTIAVQGQDFDTTGNWQFFVTADRRLTLFRNNSPQSPSTQSMRAVAFGVWQHIAATFDSGVVTYYINGIEEPAQQYGSNSFNATNAGLKIGEREFTGDPDNILGNIDEFRVYNRALSELEIKELASFGGATSACLIQDGVAIAEDIKDIGTCGPVGVKSPNWGQFGRKQVLESDIGERLEIECTGVFLQVPTNAFQLFYTPPGGERVRVGICPWEGGCNSMRFFHSGDKNNNGMPDCFTSTSWTSRDYGQFNDQLPWNPWTGEINPFENKLDWAISYFDVNNYSLTKYDIKHEYAVSPPLNCSSFPKPEGRRDLPIVIDPPIGPETEAFFDQVLERLEQIPSSDVPMGEYTLPPCDFDGDGDCDSLDEVEFSTSKGACSSSSNYNPQADYDGNGCVDNKDRDYLFVLDDDGDGIQNVVDECRNSNLSSTVIIDGYDSGVTNHLQGNGCTISDEISNCAESANNHRGFVSCVSSLTNTLKKTGLISISEKVAIQRLLRHKKLQHKKLRHKKLRHKKLRHKKLRHKKLRHKKLRHDLNSRSRR